MSDMLERSSYDRTCLASFLTYFGMLTIESEVVGVGFERLVTRELSASS